MLAVASWKDVIHASALGRYTVGVPWAKLELEMQAGTSVSVKMAGQGPRAT